MQKFWLIKYSSGSKARQTVSSFDLVSTGIEECKVFTTVSSICDPKGKTYLPFLDAHIQRLSTNAQELGLYREHLLEHQLSWIKNRVKKTALDYLTAYEAKRIRLRIVMSNSGVELWFRDAKQAWLPEESIRLASYIGARKIPHIKSTAIELSSQAQAFAKDSGADHALLVGADSNVLECDWANIFWFDTDSQLQTNTKGALRGIIQSQLIRALKVEESIISLDTLSAKAHSIFVTKSTTGIQKVESIDGQNTTHNDTLHTEVQKALSKAVLANRCLIL